MDALKKKRGTIRTTVTRLIKKIDELFQASKLDEALIQVEVLKDNETRLIKTR